jgi:serine/threonine-protein kinase
VLAIDPANADVAPRLSRLRRSRLRKRVAAYGAVLALLVPITWLGARGIAAISEARRASLSRAPSVPPPDPAPSAAVAPATDALTPDAPAAPAAVSAPTPAPGPESAAPAHPAPPASTIPTGARPRPSPPPVLTLTPLSVYVRPYAQRALLDGVEVARGQQQIRFDLGPGTHLIQLEHACCFTFVKRITAEEAGHQQELRVPLEAKPARLRVEGDPVTQVFVNGKPYGSAGDSQRNPFAVPLPADAENPYEVTARIGL